MSGEEVKQPPGDDTSAPDGPWDNVEGTWWGSRLENQAILFKGGEVLLNEHPVETDELMALQEFVALALKLRAKKEEPKWMTSEARQPSES